MVSLKFEKIVISELISRKYFHVGKILTNPYGKQEFYDILEVSLSYSYNIALSFADWASLIQKTASTKIKVRGLS